MNAFFTVPKGTPRKGPERLTAPTGGRDGITKDMVPFSPVRMKTVYPVGENSFRARRDK